MSKIKTFRVGNRLVVMNGVDPIAYIDLTKVNKGNKSKAIVRFSNLPAKGALNLYYKVTK